MTTGVVDILAAMFDDVERSRYVFYDGQPVVRPRGRGHCCWLPRDEGDACE